MASVVEASIEAPASARSFMPDAGTRLLVVAPHPDDETIGNGELIQHVAAAGGEVAVLLLTDGDNNPWPQRWLERRVWIGPGDRRRWGERRRLEVNHALRRLGVAEQVLHPMGWPDMGLAGLLRERSDAMVATISEWLRAFDPNVIVFPSLEDRHPDHGSAHVLVRLAVAACGKAPLLLGYLVHGDAAGEAPDVALPSGAAIRASKLHALEAHHSQMALSAARMRRMTARPERYTRVAPVLPGRGLLPWQPPRTLWPWLRLTLVDQHGAKSWPWRHAPLQRTTDGRWHLQALAPPAPAFVRLECTLRSPWIFDHWGWCEL